MGEQYDFGAAELARSCCVHSDLLDQYGVRLNVLGQKERLPPSVRQAIKKAEDMTAKNDRCVPNTSKRTVH